MKFNSVKTMKAIQATIIAAEGICTSIVVDGALKAVKCNKVVKLVGRSMVSTMISAYTVNLITEVLEDIGDDNNMHGVIIDAPRGKNLFEKYATGDTVTISAEDLLHHGEDFMYWYSDDVEFDDAQSPTTTFVMPDKSVKISFAYGFGDNSDETTADDEIVNDGDEMNIPSDL